jgi:hypothetical protein
MARGYVCETQEQPEYEHDRGQIIALLTDRKAVNRTLGALSAVRKPSPELVPLLCERLYAEKALYTRIALGQALLASGDTGLRALILLLGEIGRNQHREPAIIDAGKRSFPLPRDYAARIICRAGLPALPLLVDVLLAGRRSQVLEAVDAYGHIAWNCSGQVDSTPLHDLLLRFDDRLVLWKVVRSLRSFEDVRSFDLLSRWAEQNVDLVLQAEACHSLHCIASSK